MDLAEAHVSALQWCLAQDSEAHVVRAFNLGTGQGASVLEVIEAFERATGETVPHTMGDRRAGDVVAIWADPSRAEKELGMVGQTQPRDVHGRRVALAAGAQNKVIHTVRSPKRNPVYTCAGVWAFNCKRLHPTSPAPRIKADSHRKSHN